jgi:N-methylhydantoinase B
MDPVTFQIIRHKFFQVTAEAMAALKNVSGTPNTNVAHDVMVSLYRADGTLLAGGAGYGHHLPVAAQAVKHLLENFSDDPGIHEGDVFFFNDPYSAALHAPDIFIMTPIFYDKRLASWVSNFVHVTDIGGIDPGGFCPNARECYQEGFQSKGLKIVERNNMRRDVLETFLNMVRDPNMVALDLKSQMAANHVARERMLKLYSDHGVDTIDSVAEELIKQSERQLRERLCELPDGTWRACEYIDVPDNECKVELAVTKEGNSLTYDFTGSSPQVAVGINCCYWATWGALFAPIYPLLAWDIAWNEGVLRPVRMVAPQGTIVNCLRPAPVSIATVGVVISVNNVSQLAITKMMGASESYKHRVTAVWRGTGTRLQVHGRTADGEYYTSMLTDTFCGSGGASATRDGIDVAGEIPNVVSAMANVETHELNTPLLYLYRRIVTDSGGAGKFRGGLSHEFAFIPHRTVEDGMGVVSKGKGTLSPMSQGVFGGYPGCNVHYATIRGIGAAAQGLALMADKAASDTTTPGGQTLRREERSWGLFSLAPGDAQVIVAMGGGGYGDPLERDTSAVLADVSGGLVSALAAHDIYGVVLTAGDTAVDTQATAARRLALRSERIGRPVDASALTRRPIKPTGMRLSEYLQRTSDGSTQCTWCGYGVAPPGSHWKDHGVQRRLPLQAAGTRMAAMTDFVLFVTSCPSCGTLLDTEVLRGDDPPRHDIIRRWPHVYG